VRLLWLVWFGRDDHGIRKMTKLAYSLVLTVLLAFASESVLGPPDSQPTPVVVEEGTPIPQEVLDCLAAALEANEPNPFGVCGLS